jgi:alanine racemase
MLPPDAQRPTWQRIDLDNLSFNLRSARDFVGSNIACMAVVKANAYGHGAVECARRLSEDGAEWLAVATGEEGIELREAGIKTPILVFGGCFPGQEVPFAKSELTPIVFTLEQAQRLDAAARQLGTKLKVHVKLDTGMHRVGFDSKDAVEVSERLAKLSGIAIDGIMTHFAAADDLDESDFTNGQAASFVEAVETFFENGHRPQYLDLANSPAAVAHPQTRLRLVRLGGILFGLGGDVLPRGVPAPELRPVMGLYSRISQLRRVPALETVGYSRTYRTERDSVIATVPIGYHDGFCRGLSNRGSALVGGFRVPVVGRVSMDWITVDVTDVQDVAEGDLVTVVGSDGDETIKAEDIAEWMDTLSYEVTCGFDGRIRKEFVSAG